MILAISVFIWTFSDIVGTILFSALILYIVWLIVTEWIKAATGWAKSPDRWWNRL